MDARRWFRQLDQRQALIQPIVHATPVLNMAELEWVSSGGLPAALGEWPTWADVPRGAVTPNAVADPDMGRVPGLLRKHAAFWDEVVLPGHHLN